MWLGDFGVAGILAGSTVEIISAVGIDITSKRKLAREFHQIADRIAENVMPLFEAEGAKIPENDMTAVVLSLGQAIERTDVTPLTLVKDYDLRASKLTTAIIDNTSNDRKLFSADANALLDRVSSECAEYIIEISTRLPSFSPALFSELPQRQKNLDDVVVEVLNEIRRLAETTRALNPEEEAGKFERRYRTAVAHRNDEVELFGLDAPSKIRRQNLKIAYVTLSMKRRSPRRQRLERIGAMRDKFGVPAGSASELIASSHGVPAIVTRATLLYTRGFRGSVLRALLNSETCDAILASAPRLLIRGEAGSGKTTLLQWATVSAASQRLEGALERWNETVPLMVQLRQYAEKALPSPKALVANALPEIGDGVPSNWVENLLEAGRAIVLLDGIDELDAIKREEVRAWVRGLIATYPNCRYILTSRMAAVEEDWLAAEKFEEAELLPMGWPDIDNLIDHWHAALAAQQSVSESPDDLKLIAGQLKKQLRQNRRLADLATSPLLCAMLCALHYERRQQLPPNRIALYDSAIRMLLDQRDRARGIGKLKLPDLTEEQKRAFLERLAYWMLRNNHAATTLTDATGEVARARPFVQNLPSDATPVRVVELLIQRSGILRSPAQGLACTWFG